MSTPPCDALERAIYAAAYALRLGDLLNAGYPPAWRYADDQLGSRIEEWERWCADLALQHAEFAVASYREASKLR